MAGGKHRKSFSLCGIFKTCFSSRRDDDDYLWDDGAGRKIFPSDEDRGRWVAEPGIDRKAGDFIARFYASRVTDSDQHFAA